MGERRGNRRSRLARVPSGSAITMVLGLVAVSCGDDGATESDAATVTDSPGATVAGAGDPANGEQLARSSGCAGCHGADFGGGAGPGWIGLAGSRGRAGRRHRRRGRHRLSHPGRSPTRRPRSVPATPEDAGQQAVRRRDRRHRRLHRDARRWLIAAASRRSRRATPVLALAARAATLVVRVRKRR